MEKMNSAHHTNAMSGMASSAGIATCKNYVDGLGLRPIFERVKFQSAEFFVVRSSVVRCSRRIWQEPHGNTRVLPNGTRDERRGRAF